MSRFDGLTPKEIHPKLAKVHRNSTPRQLLQSVLSLEDYPHLKNKRVKTADCGNIGRKGARDLRIS